MSAHVGIDGVKGGLYGVDGRLQDVPEAADNLDGVAASEDKCLPTSHVDIIGEYLALAMAPRADQPSIG